MLSLFQRTCTIRFGYLADDLQHGPDGLKNFIIINDLELAVFFV